MSNIVEQAAAGALLVVFMAGLVAVAIGFVACCDRLKDRLCGIRRIPKAQRNLVNAWRLHMIAKGRATLEDRSLARAIATGVRCDDGGNRGGSAGTRFQNCNRD